MKMTAFLDDALCSLIEIKRRLRRFHHQADDGGSKDL
jgi:hypothetical protein